MLIYFGFWNTQLRRESIQSSVGEMIYLNRQFTTVVITTVYDGIDAQIGPIAIVSLWMNGTQLYDIWHGPLMQMFINGTQTIDNRGYP